MKRNEMNEKLVAYIEKKFGEVEMLNVAEDEKNIFAVFTTAEDAEKTGQATVAKLVEVNGKYGPYYKLVETTKKEYYKVTDYTPEETAAEEPEELELEIEEEAQEVEEKPETDAQEAVEAMKKAQAISILKGLAMVLSNGKRIAVVKTEANKNRHMKYGYQVAAIFENGVQVSA